MTHVTVLSGDGATTICASLRRIGVAVEESYGGKLAKQLRRSTGEFVVIPKGETAEIKCARNGRSVTLSLPECVEALQSYYDDTVYDFTEPMADLIFDAEHRALYNEVMLTPYEERYQ